MKQIFFSIPEAAAHLFPERTKAGAQKVLRRMVREKEIPATHVGRQPYISRATLLGFGVEFDQRLEAVKVGSDQLENAGNSEEKEIVKDYDDDDCDFPY